MQNSVKFIETIVYAGRLKNKEALMKSSSGGAFTAISDVLLNRDGAVACSIYNYAGYTEEFRLINTKEQRDEARGSKYMQSKPGNVYLECANWLKKNTDKQLLFVGMGCQADGFRKYIELTGLRSRVYIVDIVCHGAPSPKLWREYIQSLEKRYHGKSSKLTFKDKRNGWRMPTAVVTINDRELRLDKYVKVFYNQCTLRPSCHECPYATIERKTDITIGDYWHIEETIPDFYDPNGNSLFLIHTNKGMELFDAAKDFLDYRLSNTKDCWQKNLEAPTPVSSQRNLFWKEYNKHGAHYIMKKYGTASLKTKLKNKIKNLFRDTN